MPQKKKQPFIVIESLDAAGGSTQLKYLKRRLEKEGYAPRVYHFPQEDKPTGQLIYQKYLHDRGKHPLSRREQALLYIQDFYSKLEEMEAIASGKTFQDSRSVILSDRYCTSTMAYQTINLTGQRRQDMLDWLTWLCWQGSPQLLRPSQVILLDLPVELSVERLKNKKKDIHERQDFLQAVRKSYLKLAQEQHWSRISGVSQEGSERTRKEIHEDIWQALQPALATKT